MDSVLRLFPYDFYLVSLMENLKLENEIPLTDALSIRFSEIILSGDWSPLFGPESRETAKLLRNFPKLAAHLGTLIGNMDLPLALMVKLDQLSPFSTRIYNEVSDVHKTGLLAQAILAQETPSSDSSHLLPAAIALVRKLSSEKPIWDSILKPIIESELPLGRKINQDILTAFLSLPRGSFGNITQLGAKIKDIIVGWGPSHIPSLDGLYESLDLDVDLDVTCKLGRFLSERAIRDTEFVKEALKKCPGDPAPLMADYARVTDFSQAAALWEELWAEDAHSICLSLYAPLTEAYRAGDIEIRDRIRTKACVSWAKKEERAQE